MLVMAGDRIGPKKPVRIYLKEWRTHLGETLEKVGSRFASPISKGQVSKIEAKAATGRIGAETVAAYAEAINRHPKEMYGPPPAPDERPTLDQTAEDLELEYEEAVRAMRIASRKAS